MDALLGGLFGGEQDDDHQRPPCAQDFVSRYEQGAPWGNISDEEAVHNYQAVAGSLSPEELEESAAETYARLSPEERRQFAQFLQQQGGSHLDAPDYDDPRQLARATSRYQPQQPDGLAGLLGGGDRSQGNMLQSPIAKAVMGGIAVIAMKKMIGGR